MSPSTHMTHQEIALKHGMGHALLRVTKHQTHLPGDLTDL